MNKEKSKLIIEKESGKLLKKKNVVAVGYGKKIKNGVEVGDAIVCAVTKKVPLDKLDKQDILPFTIYGEYIDVIEIGKIKALSTNRLRPCKGGDSLGHKDITAGTLGLLVNDLEDNTPVILSNNHVLADSNNALINDEILQPGPIDGGNISTDIVGRLKRFIPIKFLGQDEPDQPPTDDSKCKIAKIFTNVLNLVAKITRSDTRVKAITTNIPLNSTNTVDCAIANVEDYSLVTKGTRHINVIQGISTVNIGDNVNKFGRTTNLTNGSVIMIDAVVDVTYAAGKVARFNNQIITTNISQGGDSGSTVYNDNQQLVGLLFAGSDTATIANKIQDVFTSLNLGLL